jgi:hypothetical protein
MQNLFLFLDLSPFLLIVAGAVFVHACFQLSVSVLTLLSSHTIGRRLPNARLLSLNFWYIFGCIVMITLLQLSVIVLLRLGMTHSATITTVVTLSLVPLVALLVVLLYYRRGRGTQLWLPRPAAQYITDRAKRTKSSVEAFTLGMATVVTELPFAIAPLAIVAFALQGFRVDRWFTMSLGYSLAVCAPLIFVAFYLSSGHKISSIQRWREDSKGFLKWTSASALLILTAYIAVLQIGAAS